MAIRRDSKGRFAGGGGSSKSSKKRTVRTALNTSYKPSKTMQKQIDAFKKRQHVAKQAGAKAILSGRKKSLRSR